LVTATNAGNLNILANSTGRGGGIFATGHSTISNATIDNNGIQESTGYGGGIFNESGGLMTVINVTLSYNFYSLFAGAQGDAASFYTNGFSYALIKNSILSSESSENNCPTNLLPADGGYNLEYNNGQKASCGFTDHAVLANPKFASYNLLDNGGPTLTHALLPSSPALSGGNDAVCAAVPVNNLDQRGSPRPTALHCDIGSYEMRQPTLNLAFIPSAILVNTQAVLQLTINNPTGLALTNVGFSDPLPAQLSFVGNTSTTCTNGVVSVSNNTVLNVGNISLGVGASCVVKVNVTAGVANKYTNVTGVISSDQTGAGPLSNSATLMVSLTPPLVPTSLLVSAGANQLAQVGTAFTNPLKVLVKDQNGNILSGVSVIFSTPQTGASCSLAGGVNTAVTDNQGVATSPICSANNSAGNYNVVASVSGLLSTASFSLTNSSTPVPAGSTSYSYNLPLLANNANTALGQTTTFITFQNLSSSAVANISLKYYAIADGTTGPAALTLTIPAKGQQAILPNIAVGSSYGGVVTSSQPLNLVVSEALNSGGSAYNVAASTASTLYTPLALNGQYGFTTSIVVFNAASSGTSTGTIQFFDETGNPVPAATQNFSVPAHASQTFNQAAASSGLVANHAYWAKIVSSSANASLTAQVIEFGPANFVATFNAIVPSQVQNTLYAPATFNGQFNFVTGMALANPNDVAASVTISYYDASGNKVFSQTNLLLAANGVVGVFQPAVNGLPNTVSSATISSSQPLVMAVNERGPGTISGTYVGLSMGSTNVALPVMANGFAGFVTGATVLNAGSSPATLTFSYLDGNGSQVGSPQTKTLAAHASFLVYQGGANQNLPAGFFGTALVSSDQPLLVTTNALNTNSGLFYTYTEPSN
jgi:uncharacterized repeat protein (TIGR01451 family)